MDTIQNAIDGRKVASSSRRVAPVYNPATGEQTAEVKLSTAEEVSSAVAAAKKCGRELGRDAAAQARPADVPLQGAASASRRRDRARDLEGARQDPRRRAWRALARYRRGRFRLRHSASPEGRIQPQCRPRDRQLVRSPAARRGRRDHPVQLPGHGADVDVSGRHRLRKHLRPEAVGARSLDIDAHLGIVQRGGLPARRAECGPRRQGSRRCHSRPSRRQGGELRRLDAGRRARLCARFGFGQTRAGSGRRQESHDRHAGCRHGPGRRCADGRGLRLGWRALHGDLGRGAGRREDGETAWSRLSRPRSAR